MFEIIMCFAFFATPLFFLGVDWYVKRRNKRNSDRWDSEGDLH